MAAKKSNPMENPPAASSSDEEEEVDESDEEEEEDVSSSDVDGDEDAKETPKLPSPPPRQLSQKRSAVKKPETAPRSKSYSTGDSDSESDSESETIATQKTTAVAKPLEETPKATKPRSKPVSSKRPNETEGSGKDTKRAKKKDLDLDLDEEEQKKPGEDTKKQLFQRLWSEEDEIAILKGMMEYTAKKGLDPNQDTQAFYEYIKNSLHVECTKTQLVDKIRRLRKKYENNLERGAKKGEDRTFSKPHEQTSYDLSKKLWGSETTGGVIESAAKSNGKPKKNQSQKGKSSAAFKAELIDSADGDKMEVDNDKENVVIDSKDKKVLFGRSLGIAGLEDFVVCDGLDMIGGAKKAELEERWKKLQVAQLELFLQRNELIQDQTKLILDVMK